MKISHQINKSYLELELKELFTKIPYGFNFILFEFIFIIPIWDPFRRSDSYRSYSF